jgi:hypothetical protein
LVAVGVGVGVAVAVAVAGDKVRLFPCTKTQRERETEAPASRQGSRNAGEVTGHSRYAVKMVRNARTGTISVLFILTGCGSSSLSPLSERDGGAADAKAGFSSDAGTTNAARDDAGTDSGADAVGDAGGIPIGCRAGAATTLPPGAPVLAPGSWKNISPPGVVFQTGATAVFTQGITLDPCNEATLYLCVCSFDVAGGNPGVYKSTDAGGTWKKVGKLDEPIHIRVDPGDPNHLYAVDGVRGATGGFWVSNDGGDTWTQPAGFAALDKGAAPLFQFDAYDVAADPADFRHVLLSFHGPWDGFGKFPAWGYRSGVLESKDGGDTWIVHKPLDGWGNGNGIWFLDGSDAWLFGSQTAGYWRTTDAGANWTQVIATVNMQHGGGTLLRTKSGVLYAGGVPHLIRSKDDGVSWTQIGPYAGFNSIVSDGTTLYSGPVGGPNLITAKESDDTTWTPYAGGPTLVSGPFEMAFDSANAIVYAGNWNEGLWALKVK